jgi:hypothetical protein
MIIVTDTMDFFGGSFQRYSYPAFTDGGLVNKPDRQPMF